MDRAIPERKSVWNRWRNRRQEAPLSKSIDVASTELFEQCLAKERARADRRSTSFALLLFNLWVGKQDAAYPVVLRSLADLLSAHTRTEDTVGWYQGRLALILTEVAPDQVSDVWKRVNEGFTAKVRGQMNGAVPISPLHCDIFRYPGEESELVDGAAQDVVGGNGKNKRVV